MRQREGLLAAPDSDRGHWGMENPREDELGRTDLGS